jgi:predicted TPR repeat methyltransferase
MRIKNKSEKWNKLYHAGAKYRQLNQVFTNRLIKKIEKMIGRKIKIVLDLGCGTGDAIDQFEKRGYESIGIDFSATAVAKAKEKNSKAQFIEHDLDLLDKVGLQETADLVICKLTVAFISDKEKFFWSIRKLMSINSVFCLITPVLHNNIDYSVEDKPGIAVDYLGIKKLLKENFGKVIEFHNEYLGEKTHIITFLATG